MKRAIGFLLVMSCVWWVVSSVMARPPAQANLFEAAILDTRSDLETLADRVFGGGTRPDGWTGNLDPGSISAVADLWVDNERLADEVFGAGIRPADWFSASSSIADLVVRNIRHDLELSADAVLGAGVRPGSWIGGDPLAICDRALQNTVYLLNTRFNIRPSVSTSVIDYCQSVNAQVEDELLADTFGAREDDVAIPGLILAVRGDIERLADEVLGLNNRPDGWVGNKDINSPALARDNLNDLSLLADVILGNDNRSVGWRGTLGGSPAQTFRNLRSDLELLADAYLGDGNRPRGWQGDDPLLVCDPDVQNLVFVVQRVYPEFRPDRAQDNYCQNVALEANLLVENPPVPEDDGQGGGGEEDTLYRAEAEWAFSYLDVAATQYMGMMPAGTEFRAWYRNFNNSTMMFVSGENFALFIDRRWTTMEDNVFRTLPTLEGVQPLTFCDANWCSGPRPTPTPTGGGALVDIIIAATPPATVSPDEIREEEGKTLVSWNHIRINYLLEKETTAQVTLEICRTVAQVACEPVTSVFNNSTGQQVPVVQQFNGLNVYELPYGYSTNLIIEGATLFSQDIWLNDPSLG